MDVLLSISPPFNVDIVYTGQEQAFYYWLGGGGGAHSQNKVFPKSFLILMFLGIFLRSVPMSLICPQLQDFSQLQINFLPWNVLRVGLSLWVTSFSTIHVILKTAMSLSLAVLLQCCYTIPAKHRLNFNIIIIFRETFSTKTDACLCTYIES